MTRDNFMALVADMKSLYTGQNFIPDVNAMEIWFDLLGDLDYEVAKKAVRAHMVSSSFPPMPKDIREKAAELVSDDYLTPMAAWDLVFKALSDSIYNSRDRFNELPLVIQRVLGTPDNLREMAMMDTSVVNSVEQSHFIKSYTVEVERDRKMKAIPENLRKLTAQTAGRLSG